MEHVKDIIFDRLKLFNLYFINNLGTLFFSLPVVGKHG